jgi:hypothetical protein
LEQIKLGFELTTTTASLWTHAAMAETATLILKSSMPLSKKSVAACRRLLMSMVAERLDHPNLHCPQIRRLQAFSALFARFTRTQAPRAWQSCGFCKFLAAETSRMPTVMS